ncbi:Helix-loop-helix DNA-binding domain-containing protein [Cladophialophora immunda]|nr:Helix-loop-helix DNA-binding domain-containing protein [Cladophialophora immunda]
MPMSAHTLVDFGISNAPLSDIDISIFQPFIRHEYLKDQPGPLQPPEQQLQLHNVTFPGQPLGTGAGPPSQFPLSPPISFSDYETLQSTTPDDCYHSNALAFEPQRPESEEDDDLTEACQQSEGSTSNPAVAPPVNWSKVVPWVSTKPPSRGRPRGTKRKSAAQNVEPVDGGATTAKPGGAKRGRKPRASRQPIGKAAPDEDDKAALKEAKAAHSVVERRYRDNLNGKMSQLYYVLREVNSPGPHSRLLSSTNPNAATTTTTPAIPAFQPPSRVRKSEILNSAIDYIHQSEVEMRHMADEIKHLQDKERTIRNLVKCEEWSVLRALLSV